MTTSQRVGSYQRHGLLPRVLLGLIGLLMIQYAADLFVSPAIRGMSSGRDYARVRMRESMSFGKYAGSSFKEIAETDRDYCSWVLGQAEDPDANPSMLEFATFLGESYPDIQAAASQPSASYDLDDNIVRFGKHAEKEYADLIMEDPQYCEWVLSQLDDPDAKDQVHHFAQWLDGNRDVLEDALAMSPSTVSFGKHKGQTYQWLLENEPDYCRYIMSSDPAPHSESLIEWLQTQEIPEAPAGGGGGPTATVSFGKHKGQTYQWLLENEPDYCRYIMDGEPGPHSESLVEWLRTQEIPEAPVGGPTATVSFGKHKGQTYQWLLENEPDYCRFVLDMEPGRNSGPLIEWLQTQEIPEAPVGGAGGPEATVTFGKHNGQTYQWLLENEPDYCRFVLDMEPGRNSGPLIEWLQTQEIPEAPVGGGGGGHGGAPGIVTFGKHKGKSYEAVLEEDTDYCQWMLERLETGEELTGGMKVFADWVYEQAVAQQEAQVGEES